MMLTRSITLAAVFAATTVPAIAEEFRAVNRLNVSAPSAAQIQVFGPAELWARGYWCAAGDYAFRRLGLGITDRLTVVAPYEKGQQSVTFSAANPSSGSGSPTVLASTIRNTGSTLSVGQARGYCQDHKLRNSR